MNRQRSIQPLLLALVFLGPLLLAALAYYGPWEWTPQAAHGELVEPPVLLPPAAFGRTPRDAVPAAPSRQRWALIYARTTPCDIECLNHLVRLRQVHLALAQGRERVQVVLLLAGAAPPLPPDAAWIATRLDDAAGASIVELLGESNIRDGRVYIADPLGKVIMSYPPDAEQKGLLQDLQRLERLVVVPQSGRR